MNIWCLDSPGIGGSEIDFCERISYLIKPDDKFILSTVCDKSVLEAAEATGCKIIFKKPGNTIRHISENITFFKSFKKSKSDKFFFWNHHYNSNRWLQVLLSFFGYKIIVCERALVANTDYIQKSRLTNPVKKFIANKAERTVLCSYSHKDFYNKIFKPKSLIVIPNTRKVGEIRDLANGYRVFMTRADDQCIITMTGRLDENKNQQVLIKAISFLANKEAYKVILIGDGTTKQDLCEKANNLGVNLIVTGFIEDPIKIVAGSDLFVFTSLSEGLPGSLIEAMAANVPCIASNIKGNNELIIHEQTGLLFDKENPEALANCIQRLSNDKHLSKKLSKQAYQHVSDNYSWETEQSLWKEII